MYHYIGYGDNRQPSYYGCFTVLTTLFAFEFYHIGHCLYLIKLVFAIKLFHISVLDKSYFLSIHKTLSRTWCTTSLHISSYFRPHSPHSGFGSLSIYHSHKIPILLIYLFSPFSHLWYPLTSCLCLASCFASVTLFFPDNLPCPVASLVLLVSPSFSNFSSS